MLIKYIYKVYVIMDISKKNQKMRRHVVPKHADFLMGGWGGVTDIKKVLLSRCPTIKYAPSPKYSIEEVYATRPCVYETNPFCSPCVY